MFACSPDSFYEIRTAEGSVIARSKVVKDCKDPQWPAVKISWQSLAAPIRRERRDQGGYDSYSESEQDDEDIEERILDQPLQIQVFDSSGAEADSAQQLLGQFTTNLRQCTQKAQIVHATLKNTKINTFKKRQDPKCCFDIINYEKTTHESYGHLHIKTAKLDTGTPDVVQDQLRQQGEKSPSIINPRFKTSVSVVQKSPQGVD